MSEEQALHWIADLFRVDTVSAETRRSDIEAWDSLGALMLLASLDSDFGIVLTDEEVQALGTVGDILQILTRHGKLVAA